MRLRTVLTRSHPPIDKMWPLAAMGMDSISFPTTRNPKRNILTRIAAFVEMDDFKSILLRYGNGSTIELWVKLGFR